MTTTIDTNLLEFLRDKVNSFIKWDLVRFFHDNPHTKDTAESIANFIGRDLRTIERELNGLVKAGVLKSKRVSGMVVYLLNNDTSVQATIDDFMEACNDRQFRVEAIQYVIQEMQFSPRHDF